MIKSKEVEKLLELAATLDKNRVSVDDFVQVVQVLTTFAKESRDLTVKELASMRTLLENAVADIRKDNSEDVLDIKGTVETRLNKALASFEKLADTLIKEQRNAVNFMYDRVSKIKDGRDGANGKDGKNGRDGRDGKDGKDGAPGKDGKDGTGGGGGASQIAMQYALGKMLKHQQFNTSSATTTLTLSDKIAGGVCIWLRYQGQMLHFGSQYTVSGTTITLTFTPDDNTIIEATYIRG